MARSDTQAAEQHSNAQQAGLVLIQIKEDAFAAIPVSPSTPVSVDEVIQ
jgi:hypothetical protein